jgi:hypothetical protein
MTSCDCDSRQKVCLPLLYFTTFESVISTAILPAVPLHRDAGLVSLFVHDRGPVYSLLQTAFLLGGGGVSFHKAVSLCG